MNKLFLFLLVIGLLECYSQTNNVKYIYTKKNIKSTQNAVSTTSSTTLQFQGGCVVPSFGMNLFFVGPTPTVDSQVTSFVTTLLSKFNVNASPYALLLSQYVGTGINVGLGSSFTQVTNNTISDSYLQQLATSNLQGLQVAFFIIEAGTTVDFQGTSVCNTCKCIF